MNLSEFEFDLPEHLIAKYPTEDRTGSRLLHLNATTGEINHYHFRNLPQLLDAKDLLVFNNTRVIPARLFGNKRTGGRVEILLERVLDQHTALVQLRSSKSPKPGMEIHLEGSDAVVEVEGRDDSFLFCAFQNLAYWKPSKQSVICRYLLILIDQMKRQIQSDIKLCLPNRWRSRSTHCGLHFDDQLLGEIADMALRAQSLRCMSARVPFSQYESTMCWITKCTQNKWKCRNRLVTLSRHANPMVAE